MKTGKVIRRLALITILSLFTMVVSYGQAALIVLILGDRVATENFHLSIDGALNFSNLPGLTLGKTNIGANFGLGTHIKLGEKWHLKPEFKPLSQKGATFVDKIVATPTELVTERVDINLNYIDIPVLVQYNITPRLFVSAGPQISFLTNATQKSQGTINEAEGSVTSDTKSLFNITDLSVALEAGYLLKIATKKSTTKLDINAFLRYSYGFTEAFKDVSLGSSVNSMFQFGLSFPFIKSPEELAKTKKK